MAAEAKDSRTRGSEFELVVEVRGVEQGNRPVSVSFPGIAIKADGSDGALATFEGPYEVFSPPGSKGIDMAVEAPIFVGLLAHAFGPAEGLYRSSKGAGVPTLWAAAGFSMTLTATTRFFGYKAGVKRSPVQVGLSQLTGQTRGSQLGATHISHNVHFWNAPDFALTFQEAKVAIRPAGHGRLALSAEYAWNQGEWTAKTNGLLLLDGSPLSEAHEPLNTVLRVAVEERDADNSDGVLAGRLRGTVARSK